MFRGSPLASLQHDGDVAVKRFSPTASHEQATGELFREIQLLGTCSHPHLLPLLGFCLAGPLPCLVLPLMPGGNFDVCSTPRASAHPRCAPPAHPCSPRTRRSIPAGSRLPRGRRAAASLEARLPHAAASAMADAVAGNDRCNGCTGLFAHA